MVTDVLPMVIIVYLMVNNVKPMLAKKSSGANPQKVAKIYEKWNKILQYWVRLKTSDELPASISSIGHLPQTTFHLDLPVKSYRHQIPLVTKYSRLNNYHLINAISLTVSQSDHIKQLTLH
jgi:hypothetical protein